MSLVIFYRKEKTSYERRSGGWSADVCASDLVAAGGHLHRAEDRQVDGSAADHRERVVAAEITRARACGHGLHAGVDQVGVEFGLGRERADAEQAVLGLQPHVDTVGNVVGDRSEERRVGKECVSTCRSRWAPYH